MSIYLLLNGLVARIRRSHRRGRGSIPRWGRTFAVLNFGEQVSFPIWVGLPFTITKSKGQTHWGSRSILTSARKEIPDRDLTKGRPTQIGNDKSVKMYKAQRGGRTPNLEIKSLTLYRLS
ncbi:hypothetical protein PHYBLDRAFT_173959 [Phycomyces blakesleeanus NRRL 1555(-)]|uniref:Uncharacterized protein n=1 Tax=Phycomyces blakesleeanus (strain ATCC 8743b / DSM 1359 / FGSC 10004 / NBRC 33097 / NRRL 1555) TaxID=763407 RepID=A0A167KAS6_PHYB8|nr:hypothetical protein PHYBLDRAFT_173959 [Phycomyces blakesleeanus NRRL 1555(-)]OAD67629.1 hypothetical protein PHYBLDRAFT_173959 [Phycomyces blakesleeanus NRRL 1555(-)]|eukprot:XP_018285669.1 hypothetical protein PHYBLDRAFT_173959 [Phycomyces blakesleeanus NRRL 1555(-)]